MKLVLPAAAAVALVSGVDAAFPADVAALMDTSVDPCDDFYQYTCGGWLQNHTLRANEESYSYSFGTIQDRATQILQDVLKEGWPLIGDLYESCMALNAISALGTKPLEADLARIQAVPTKKELAKLAGSMDLALFTDFGVFPDLHDAKTNVLYMGSANLLLPDETYYTDEDKFEAVEAPFRTYISTLVTLANLTVDGQQELNAKYVEDLVIDIESQFAAIQPTQEEIDGYHSTTYREAAEAYPLTFHAMTEGLGLLKRSALTVESKVLLDSAAFMDRAETLLVSFDLEDLKLYYSFVYVHSNVAFLGDAFGQASFDLYNKALSGVQERSPRNEICSHRVLDLFPDLVGKYYFLKTFDADREPQVQAMVRAIEQTMGEHIVRLTWLDDATRQRAAEKLAKVANLVGHSTATPHYPFVLARDQFFNNARAVRAYNSKLAIAKINTPVDRSAWGSTSAAEVNAFYAPLLNRMTFPAAILQPPFFRGGAHPVQNFGAIGVVIGHELTHGFDNSGRDFDGDGTKRDWWTASAAEAFEERAKCLEDQYSAMVAVSANNTPLGHVNGTLTIGENIADNGGVSLALDAYHAWAAKNGTAFNTGSVEDNEVEQLFFVSYGQIWCSQIRDEAQKQLLDSDPHAPEQARVNGVVMNSEAFARAFQCPAGSKMNPKKKCQLW